MPFAAARGRTGALRTIGISLASACLIATAGAEETIDFSDKVTPLCKVEGLNVPPPDGWFNVPIESTDPTLRGCQMMRTREDEALVGIARVLSVTLPEPTVEPPWPSLMLALEHDNIARMGYVPGEVLWSRDSVPVSGEGFSGARAVGLSARVEGNDAPQEAHFLVFEKGLTKYVVTLLTPARAVDGGVYYERNVADFGRLIGSFTVPSQ